MTPSTKRRVLCLLLAVSDMAAGIAVRFGRFGLPPAVVKYGGSALWAVMIYLLVAALLPRLRPVHAAVLAGAACCAVECFKLVHTPALDAFRLTLTGKLLLGRFFSGRDLLAYALALATACCADRLLLGRRSGPPR